MKKINLINILCNLVNDEDLFTNDMENIEKKKIKKNKKKNINIMSEIVTDYSILLPYEIQTYTHLPYIIKKYLNENYCRYGIKNLLDRDLNMINMSFLNSLNILLRPEIHKMSSDDQIKNYITLENFLSRNILKNFQIDKIKNTKKVQLFNKELVKNMYEGKISHELIQTIINIFEINLIVFDLVKTNINFYWCKGIIYPYLNTFKDIYCMTVINGNYEPLMQTNNIIEEKQKIKLYELLLSNKINEEIISYPEIKINTISMFHIFSWNISFKTLLMISKNYLKNNNYNYYLEKLKTY